MRKSWSEFPKELVRGRIQSSEERSGRRRHVEVGSWWVEEQEIYPVGEPGSIHPLGESLLEGIIFLSLSLFIYKGEG